MDLQELSDRQEIVDVITRYTRAIDTRSWDDLDAVFTEDAILDYSAVGGPADVLSVAKPWVAQGLGGFLRYQHVIGQVSIELDGDSASATAYFTNPMVAPAPGGGESIVEVGGYYHHDLVRTPAGWRSKRMVDDNVWMRGF
jgi:hypothetical protein